MLYFGAGFHGAPLHGMTGLFGAALNGVAGFVGDVAGSILGVFQGLANIGFTGFGYHFGGAIVAHLHFGRRSGLGEAGSGKRKKGEEQSCFFHGQNKGD